MKLNRDINLNMFFHLAKSRCVPHMDHASSFMTSLVKILNKTEDYLGKSDQKSTLK